MVQFNDPNIEIQNIQMQTQKRLQWKEYKRDKYNNRTWTFEYTKKKKDEN